MFRRPIHAQSLIVMTFVTEGDKTDQKKPSLKMSIFTAHTYSSLAFIFNVPGTSLKFHSWDWDLARNQAGKWDLDRVWARKWDLYPPFRTLFELCSGKYVSLPIEEKRVFGSRAIRTVKMLFGWGKMFFTHRGKICFTRQTFPAEQLVLWIRFHCHAIKKSKFETVQWKKPRK